MECRHYANRKIVDRVSVKLESWDTESRENARRQGNKIYMIVRLICEANCRS